MARSKRQGILSLRQVLEQLQNDSDSGEEFDCEENDPLFDSGCSFEPVSVPGFQPTPSTPLGVTTFALSQHDTNETRDSVKSNRQADQKFISEQNAKKN